jgi:serine protease Do
VRATVSARIAVLLAACVSSWGCAAAAGTGAPAPGATTPLPDYSAAVPMGFEKLAIGIPRGERIGSIQGGLMCLEKRPLAWDRGPEKEDPTLYAGAFAEALEAAGYPVRRPGRTLFDEAPGSKPDLVAGAVIDHLTADLCFPLGGVGDFTKEKGSGEVNVTWQIYSRSRREVVFQAQGKGRGQLPEGSTMGPDAIAVDAFADAARNLLADPDFQAFVAGYTPGAPPPPVLVSAAPPRDGPIRGHMAALRGAVVTVTFRDGHGSGFLIDPQGYVLTNAHVVHDARLATVRLVTGREIVGEVVRVDPERDVALIKLEEGHLPAVALRPAEPGVGEEVYAVGSPLDEALHTTVTRGIVSGYREMDGQRYIQSDVNIQPGNSGGPLVDASGNVVGISVRGRMHEGTPVGINFFIPIGEALASVNVQTGGGP